MQHIVSYRRHFRFRAFHYGGLSLSPAAMANTQQYETSLSGNYLAGRVAGGAQDNDLASHYFTDALEAGSRAMAN